LDVHAYRLKQWDAGALRKWYLVDDSGNEHLAITARFDPDAAGVKWHYDIEPEIRPIISGDTRKLPEDCAVDVKALLGRLMRAQPLEDHLAAGKSTDGSPWPIEASCGTGVEGRGKRLRDVEVTADRAKEQGPHPERKLTKRALIRQEKAEVMPEADFNALLEKIKTRKECRCAALPARMACRIPEYRVVHGLRIRIHHHCRYSKQLQHAL
jgi:hypothetical protein